MNDTLKMDGLIREEDIANRHKVMMQCRECAKWTTQNLDNGRVLEPCDNCRANSFDLRSAKSLRTFNILTDSKRKVKK